MSRKRVIMVSDTPMIIRCERLVSGLQFLVIFKTHRLREPFIQVLDRLGN